MTALANPGDPNYATALQNAKAAAASRLPERGGAAEPDLQRADRRSEGEAAPGPRGHEEQGASSGAPPGSSSTVREREPPAATDAARRQWRRKRRHVRHCSCCRADLRKSDFADRLTFRLPSRYHVALAVRLELPRATPRFLRTQSDVKFAKSQGGPRLVGRRSGGEPGGLPPGTRHPGRGCQHRRERPGANESPTAHHFRRGLHGSRDPDTDRHRHTRVHLGFRARYSP